jgi:hypothetical protein
MANTAGPSGQYGFPDPEAMEEEAPVWTAEQYQARIQTLQKEREEIIRDNDNLVTLNNQYKREAASAGKRPQDPQTPAPQVARLPTSEKIPTPDHFYGDQHKVRSWLLQLRMKLDGNKEKFTDEASRIHYALSLTRGPALEWAEPYVSKTEGYYFETFNDFEREVREAFGDPNPQGTAEQKLRTLQQGRDELSTYYTKFQAIVMHLTLNDEAKSMHFRQGMNRQIKEKLIGQDTTDKTFQQFVRHCLSIDNDIRAFEQEQSSSSRGNWKGKNVANNSRRRYQGDNNGYTQRSRTNANHHFRSTNTPRYDDGTTPMDLDATGQHKRLSEEERERLSASKSCFKCKKPGHFARNCREKAEPSTRNNYNNNGNRRNNDSSKKKYGQDRTIAATYYHNGYEQPLNTSLTNPYLTTPVFLPAPPIESQQGSPDQEQLLDSAEEEVVATNDRPAPTTTGSSSATSPPQAGIGSPAGSSEQAGTPSFPSSIDTDTERLILGENQTILHQQAFDVIGIHVTGIQAVLETMSTTVGTKRPSDSLESPAKHLRTTISPDFVIAEGEDAWNTKGPTTIPEEDPVFREYWPLSEPSPAEVRWIARNPLTMEMINGYFRRDTTGRLWETFEYPVYTNRDGRKVYQIDHRMIQLQGTDKCDSEYCCYWGRRVDLGISRWTFERKCARSCNNFTCKVCHVTASPTHSSLFHDTCGNCRD